ncbi:LysR substrate-binding domain-containing protein [Trinickia caryophylli]|uniref:Transcriptional regulator, LysR family n=1 Tax=Trinickia caryophylli TaxID=28094 RepID=A0A1X7D794_TRICW|nr:LysR family transcriptional regulator [Trinickia caryophylli]TRX15056.1 LysR family transcriptional regulator [Trinickia caryophylli]WQE14915.1 LysR substrate-binding domain-containing protein [Trinickia caryophylli]GLU31358.1 LysR family transcriptional regulator [Trinickia caryophylli]SMF10179.1 transcriptional regulator, LysR family [Trinickia caryophylli]
MDRIQAMEVFTRVVDANSFTRAADTLGMPRASVTTIIQNLEALLGVRLMHRTTRRLSLTPDGAAYYEHCIKILAEIAEADASFQAGKRKPSGLLRVHMPTSLGHRLVIPELPIFRQRYPDVTLDVGLSDRAVDPVEEGVDCMVRIGPLEDSSMVARRIGVLKRVTCGSPGYLAHYGEPKDIHELPMHYAVNFRASQGARPVPWVFMIDGKPVEVPMNGTVTVNDSDAYVTCGLAGFGLIQPTLFMVLPQLLDGSLKEVLPGLNPKPKPISIVYPHNRHLSAKVRVFADWIAELFESMPALEGSEDWRRSAAKAAGHESRSHVAA